MTVGSRMLGERSLAVAIWLAFAAWIFAHFVGEHYALGDWLFFRYATYFLVAGSLLVSTTLLGVAIVRRTAGTALPMGESFVVAVPVGLTAFALLWCLLGFVGLLNVYTFFGLPLACAAAGFVDSRRWLRRIHRHRRRLFRVPQASLVSYVVFGAGLLGIVLLYFPILTPDHTSYDTRWYHMAIAERYAVEGGISMYREGWLAGAMPQLVSFVYSWAFLVPGTHLFDRMELCAHVEFVYFVATLPGIVVVVRRVLGKLSSGAELSWVSLFAFPGIFLYDSNLVAGADHLSALWAAPLFLAFLRAYRALRVRPLLVLAFLVAGLMHVKYTAYQLLVFPLAALAVRLLVLVGKQASARRLDPRLLLGPGAAALAVVVLWAPHWLKNYVWYRNPVFPIASGVFHSLPWVPNVAARESILYSAHDWEPTRDLDGVVRTFRALADFSFLPNNWPTFHGMVPVFGSLFTLTVPCLLFFRNARLWALYGWCHVAILFWYWTSHQDRYLQTSLPLMAAGTAAVLISVWQLGVLPRVAVVALVGLQVVWGGDIPFFPTHSMLRTSPFKTGVEFLARGHKGDRNERFRMLPDIVAMGEATPKRSVILMHEEALTLGIGRKIVTDLYTSGLEYAREASPDRMYDHLHRLGVTHIAADPESNMSDSLGGDLAFFYFFERHATQVRNYGGYALRRMPAARPSNEGFHDRVLVLACDGHYESGTYTFEDLDIPPTFGNIIQLPPNPTPFIRVATEDQALAVLDDVDAVAHDSCFPLSASLEAHGFSHAETREKVGIFVRKATR